MKIPKKKSDILTCVIKEGIEPIECPRVDAKVIDGAAVINMLIPTNGKTFEDYAKNTFVPYIRKLSADVNRIDIVWDRYFEDRKIAQEINVVWESGEK